MFLYLKVNKLVNLKNILEDEYFLFYEIIKNNKNNNKKLKIIKIIIKKNKNNNVLLGLFFKSFYEKYHPVVMKFSMLNLSTIKQ